MRRERAYLCFSVVPHHLQTSESTELMMKSDTRDLKRKRKMRLASDHRLLLELSVHFHSALEEIASREDVPSNNKHDEVKYHSL